MRFNLYVDVTTGDEFELLKEFISASGAVLVSKTNDQSVKSKKDILNRMDILKNKVIETIGKSPQAGVGKIQQSIRNFTKDDISEALAALEADGCITKEEFRSQNGKNTFRYSLVG